MECASCHRLASQPQACPQCLSIFYCSLECRVKDWGISHHKICQNQKPPQLQEYEEHPDPQFRFLGKGSYGEVRLVRHLRTGEYYAMKVIDKRVIEREGTLEALRREITVHYDMRHKHIIQLFEHFEDDSKVYMIMEYAPNGSVFNVIRKEGKLSEDRARVIFKQVCLGIQFLHQNNVMHRDLKPENMLIDANNNVKICDFGWSYKGADSRNTFCGTIEYMAPEMVNSQGHSFGLDIWALGVFVYELTHGHSPFNAMRDADKYSQILNNQVSFGAHASAELKDLIMKLLRPNPEDRLPIGDILKHSWLTGSIRPGITIRHYVNGYGISDGIIQNVKQDYCEVFFKGPGKLIDMPTSQVQRILKRNNELKSRNASPIRVSQNTSIIQDLRNKSKTPSNLSRSFNLPISPNQSFMEANSLNQSTIDTHEATVLDQVESWCAGGNLKKRRRKRHETTTSRPRSRLKTPVASQNASLLIKEAEEIHAASYIQDDDFEIPLGNQSDRRDVQYQSFQSNKPVAQAEIGQKARPANEGDDKPYVTDKIKALNRQRSELEKHIRQPSDLKLDLQNINKKLDEIKSRNVANDQQLYKQVNMPESPLSMIRMASPLSSPPKPAQVLKSSKSPKPAQVKQEFVQPQAKPIRQQNKSLNVSQNQSINISNESFSNYAQDTTLNLSPEPYLTPKSQPPILKKPQHKPLHHSESERGLNLTIPSNQKPPQHSPNRSLNTSYSRDRISYLPDGRIDYKQQRELIEQRTLGYFSKLEDSVIDKKTYDEDLNIEPEEIPKLDEESFLNSSRADRYSQYDEILYNEQKKFQKSKHKARLSHTNIDTSNAALNKRRQELEKLIGKFEQPRSSVPIRQSEAARRPQERRSELPKKSGSKPRRHKKEDDNFFTWLGKVIGCVDRAMGDVNDYTRLPELIQNLTSNPDADKLNLAQEVLRILKFYHKAEVFQFKGEDDLSQELSRRLEELLMVISEKLVENRQSAGKWLGLWIESAKIVQDGIKNLPVFQDFIKNLPGVQYSVMKVIGRLPCDLLGLVLERLAVEVQHFDSLQLKGVVDFLVLLPQAEGLNKEKILFNTQKPVPKKRRREENLDPSIPSLKQTIQEDPDISSYKQSVMNVWKSLLNQELPQSLVKLILRALPKNGFPKVSEPLYFSEFLLRQFDLANSLSIKSLTCLFILITKYKLECKQYYIKLYTLIKRKLEIGQELKPNFLKLVELSISSPLLPLKLVAAYIKVTDIQLFLNESLRNTKQWALWSLGFSINCYRLHPALSSLLSKKLDVDPYNKETDDPYESNAKSSALWELQLLQKHYWPQVRHLCSEFKKSVEKIPKYNLANILKEENSNRHPIVRSQIWNHLFEQIN